MRLLRILAIALRFRLFRFLPRLHHDGTRKQFDIFLLRFHSAKSNLFLLVYFVSRKVL